MSHEVFISYSSRDKSTADAVCAKLEATGIRCWIAPRDIVPGTEYGGAIIDAITQSRFMVLILTSSANQSPQIIREVERGVSKGVIIIPFRVEDVTPSKSLEFFLSTPHWLDAMTPPLEQHIEHLAKTLLLLKSQSGPQTTARSSDLHPSRPSSHQPDAESALSFQRLVQEPGKLVDQQLGSYVVRQVIGKGGSGIVYRAVNPKLGQETCVKVFYPLRPDVADVARVIERGVRGIAALNHPYIVRILDFANFSLGGTSSFYLVMELVKGTTLSQWIAGHSTNEALLLAAKIAHALEAAHQATYFDEAGFEQHGVLHGDIKPENILVRADNTPVLLDFMMVDMQRLLDRTIVPAPNVDAITAAFGTPNYMAPEQELRGLITVKTDIFSLGRTYYELFFPNDWRRLSLIDFEGMELETGAPQRDLRILLRRMTHKDPSQRPADMSEVIAEIARATKPTDSRQRAVDASSMEFRRPDTGTLDRNLVSTPPAKPPGTGAPTVTGSLPPVFGAQPETPLYLDDNVQFTVYRPKVIVPQKWYSLLAFAHLSEKRADAGADEPDPIAEVREQAERILGEQTAAYQNLTQDTSQTIPREGLLTFVPEMPGIEFNPPRHSFTWDEPVHREEFRLRARPDALDGKAVKGHLSVFLGIILLAEIPLSIRVDSQHVAVPQTKSLEETHARPYRKIFASYSHRDLEVVEQFERFVEALGDRYLRDVEYLRGGEVWSERLEQMIVKADVFQLFWSTNSMHSPFVKQEWEYALALQRPNFIRPTYWEDPLPAQPHLNLPPDELMRLHFQRIQRDGGAREDLSQPTAVRITAPLPELPSGPQATPMESSIADTREPPLSREGPSSSAPPQFEKETGYSGMGDSLEYAAPTPPRDWVALSPPPPPQYSSRSGAGGKRLDFLETQASQRSNKATSALVLVLAVLAFGLLAAIGFLFWFLRH